MSVVEAGLVAQKARFEAALRQASTDLPLGAVAAGYSADWNGIVANIIAARIAPEIKPNVRTIFRIGRIG